MTEEQIKLLCKLAIENSSKQLTNAQKKNTKASNRRVKNRRRPVYSCNDKAFDMNFGGNYNGFDC